jgi:hypothetical protein
MSATLKQVLQDFIAPKLEALKGEISSVREEARIDEKLTFTNKRLDEALEIRERLAALEAKVGR